MTLPINHQPWTANAKCLGEDITAYESRNLPLGAPRKTTAAKLCNGCPVLKQCGQYALDNPDTLGVIMAGIAYPDHIGHPQRIHSARKAIAEKIGAPTPPPIGTPRDTITATTGGGYLNAQKTHCKHGHPYTPTNTRYAKDTKGREARRCRTCDQATDRKRRHNRQDTAA